MADPLESLREAVRLSPDNLPLRKHFAEALLGAGRPEEAEREYRQALARWPDDTELKLGLAGTFYREGKNSTALVILEDILGNPSPPARAHLLHARLLLRAGDVDRQVATLEFLVVKKLHGLVGFVGTPHFHEGEAA